MLAIIGFVLCFLLGAWLILKVFVIGLHVNATLVIMLIIVVMLLMKFFKK